MLLLFLVGLSLAGASVVLVARATIMPRLRASQAVGRIASYGFVAPTQEDAPRSVARNAIDGVAASVGGLAERFGGFREASLRRELVGAGIYNLPPRKFLGYRILSAIVLPALWLWIASAAGYPTFLVLLGTVLALLMGWTAPMSIVRRRGRDRSEKVDYELPNLIDLLVVSVEAGLGFTGSLQLAAERFGGPLGDELRLTLQEQSMGLSTNEALRNLLHRCDSPLMRSFVRSVLQGETLGVSIGQIMRDLSVDMRKRRRQAAEERAQKAPIKLLFPLVFLIFPAMFLVILGPAVFAFLKAFGGG
ncbi:MAG TPA: type II secretion system F family protein [Gaiellaceae bacterium]|nr:type II secretion system F family protein [Gaiellaceae bacterium]